MIVCLVSGAEAAELIAALAPNLTRSCGTRSLVRSAARRHSDHAVLPANPRREVLDRSMFLRLPQLRLRRLILDLGRYRLLAVRPRSLPAQRFDSSVLGAHNECSSGVRL